MSWETILPRAGERSGQAGVTVAWRIVGGGKGAHGWKLAITIGDEVRRRAAISTDHMFTMQFNQLENKLRIVAGAEGWKGHRRSWPGSKDGYALVFTIPLDHVALRERKPAQPVPWDLLPAPAAGLEIKLPAWAAGPPVRITRPAIALRE